VHWPTFQVSSPLSRAIHQSFTPTLNTLHCNHFTNPRSHHKLQALFTSILYGLCRISFLPSASRRIVTDTAELVCHYLNLPRARVWLGKRLCRMQANIYTVRISACAIIYIIIIDRNLQLIKYIRRCHLTNAYPVYSLRRHFVRTLNIRRCRILL